MRIDILNSISGVNFDEAYKGKIDADIDGLKISFINIRDFIANKQAFGGEKDLRDIKAVQAKNK